MWLLQASQSSFKISELGKMRNAESNITEVKNPRAFHSLVENSCMQGTEAVEMVMCTCAHLSAEGNFIFTESGLNTWRKPTFFGTQAVDKFMIGEIKSVDVWKFITWRQFICSNNNPIIPKELNISVISYCITIILRNNETFSFWYKTEKQAMHKMASPYIWGLTISKRAFQL